MAQSRLDNEKHDALATHDHVKSVLGDIDDDKMLAIMALRPTIMDVEEASCGSPATQTFSGPGGP